MRDYMLHPTIDQWLGTMLVFIPLFVVVYLSTRKPKCPTMGTTGEYQVSSVRIINEENN